MNPMNPGVEGELRNLREQIELQNLIEVYKLEGLLEEDERDVVKGQIRRMAGIDGWVARQIADRKAATVEQFTTSIRARLRTLGWTVVEDDMGADDLLSLMGTVTNAQGQQTYESYRKATGVEPKRGTLKEHVSTVRRLELLLKRVKAGDSMDDIMQETSLYEPSGR